MTDEAILDIAGLVAEAHALTRYHYTRLEWAILDRAAIIAQLRCL